MTISLGTITLDDRLLLRGTFSSPQTSIKISRTLSGVNVPTSRPTPGRELELTTEGPNGVKAGLFTRAQLNDVAALRDAAQPITLSYHTATYRVMLPSDSIQVSSVTESAVSNSANKFIGSIRLVEV